MSKDKLKINISPFGFMDLLAFKKLIPARKKKFDCASSASIDTKPPMNLLAERIHPKLQYLTIVSVTEETPYVKTFKLVPEERSSTKQLAVFRPGQYLSLYVEINGVTVTRPYSISSSPKNALEGFYDITIKKNEEGFVTNYIWDHWTTGTNIVSSGPEGQFYYDDLRDCKKITGIAGGSGITPFRSMARSIVEGKLDIELTLLYGCNKKDEIIFFDEFNKLQEAAGGKFKIVYILCEEKARGCEHGFITPALIKKYADIGNSSFFICGPQAMYDFVSKGLSDLGLKKKFIRREVFGEIKNIEKYPGFPSEAVGKSFCVKATVGNIKKEVPAFSNESVLVALERAGLCPPSACRSGACGFCRSLLVNGDVFIPEDEDGRRHADKQLGYIHICSSFPISDLEILVPGNK